MSKGVRIVLLAAAVLLVCLSLPKIVKTRDVGGPSWSWAKLEADGVSFKAPAGWEVSDPFNSHVAYSSTLWYHDSPSHETRVAYVRTENRGTQAMLILGDRGELMKLVAKHQHEYDDHPLCTVTAQAKVKTADGHELHYAVVHMKPGLLAGEDVTLVLGFADLGDRALVVNGGGLTARFDLAGLLDTVKSMRLG